MFIITMFYRNSCNSNSADPDQMPHSAASDLGLHCLPITLLGVSRLKWVTLKQGCKILCPTELLNVLLVQYD